MTSQITVRARDCLGRPNRPPSIGDTLAYRGQDWMIVGLFMGTDPITSEVVEYLVLDGRIAEERPVVQEGREDRARVF